MEIKPEFEEILKDYRELSEKIQDPKIVSNPKQLENISKNIGALMPIVEKINQLKRLTTELSETKSLANSSDSDSEMSDYVEEEIYRLKLQVENLTDELSNLLKKSDPNDTRNAIVEIRAGTGGEEAALFASDLHRMYSRYAETNNWKIQILHSSYSGNGGLKEIIFMINGDGVYGQLKYESGVHRVQRVPSTESSGRIHTSAASVVVLPEVEDVDIEINESELKIDVYRSSGPGGQSVNTTDSAVRITHTPTGIVVTCQDEKSQHKNKARALSILKSKLYEIEMEKQQKEASTTRQSSIKGGDRSVKIRTYNFPDGRITDHRIKKTWYSLTQIMDGDLKQVITTVAEEMSALDET
jgi:peptide chain release factor 1